MKLFLNYQLIKPVKYKQQPEKTLAAQTVEKLKVSPLSQPNGCQLPQRGEPLAKTERDKKFDNYCIYPNVAKASPFGRGGRRPERVKKISILSTS